MSVPSSASSQGQHRINRRRLLHTAGAAILSAPVLLRGRIARAQGREIRIGFVDPRTGPLAAFGDVSQYVIDSFLRHMNNEIQINGTTHPLRLIFKDTQSNPNRASEVANELISKEKVDLVLASSTPDTTNPVADQCEINEVPCITTDCPWQPYFFGRGGNPQQGFSYTYHFFWGLEDIIANFLNMWEGENTNRLVGGLFPNDADGNAWGDKERGFPKPLKERGFSLVDPGRYQPFSDDFTKQINAFKQAKVEIITGVMVPPDFTTFWGQAAQLGFRPKIATIGKALLFPSSVEALGDRAEGLSSEVWWSPTHPFRSSLTGQSAKALSAEVVAQSGRPWTQPTGFKHALLEIAANVLKRSANIDKSESIVDAIRTTSLDTIVGRVDWRKGKGPVPNVSKTPLVGGQWQRARTGKFPWSLTIVNNKEHPNIPLGGKFMRI